MLADIERDGYAHLSGILTPGQVKEVRELVLRDIDRLPHMANSDAMWHVRSAPAVKEVFRAIWGCSDLLSSFDGIGYRRCGEDGLELCWHADQDRHHPAGSMQCVQAIVALSPSDRLTGGLKLLPRSHRFHASVSHRGASSPKRRQFLSREWQFAAVDDDDEVFRQCPAAVQPRMEPGDLVVWDSRTLHCVEAPLSRDTTERMIAYVSMVPAFMADAATVKRRKSAYIYGMHSTHWPHHMVDRGEQRGPRRKWREVPAAVEMLVTGRRRM